MNQTVKNAVLGTLATLGVSALATGAFQPVAEVTYGISDKLVNAYVPKSYRKPLPNSAKVIQPVKIDPSNTPKGRAKFDREKDEESWNLIKEDLDKLSMDEVKKYGNKIVDKKYEKRLDDYKSQRLHGMFEGDKSEASDELVNQFGIDQPVDLSKENLTPEEIEKKRKVKKALKIAGGVALGAGALTGLGYLGYKKDKANQEDLNKIKSVISESDDLINKLNLRKDNIETSIKSHENILSRLGYDIPYIRRNNFKLVNTDYSQSNLAFKENSHPYEELTLVDPKAEKKRKVKKALIITSGAGALAGIGTLGFGLGRVTGKADIVRRFIDRS